MARDVEQNQTLSALVELERGHRTYRTILSQYDFTSGHRTPSSMARTRSLLIGLCSIIDLEDLEAALRTPSNVLTAIISYSYSST
eukprot:750903-Hanusia_phi.AAC.3